MAIIMIPVVRQKEEFVLCFLLPQCAPSVCYKRQSAKGYIFVDIFGPIGLESA